MSLIQLLPEHFAASSETVDYEAALESVLNTLLERHEDCVKQLDLEQATWGLDFWERAYGIVPDISRLPDFRRSRIRSKMRGAGTCNSEMIKNMAESFVNGQVELTETPSGAQVQIKFVSQYGVPSNQDDLTRALREVMPAHIAIVYSYTYLLWATVDAAEITFAVLDTKNLTWTEFEKGEWLGA